MIEDEQGFVQPETFRSMFFMYFKGERYAYQLYELLLPAVSLHYDQETEQTFESEDPRATDANKVVQI